MIPVPEGWSPRSTADYYLHDGEPRGFDRAALVRALMSTSFVVNTGEDPLVGGSRPMTGTEANDVADLVFGAAPDREGSPFDLQVLDVEPRHEVQCPACGATIRARMADAPDDQGDDGDDAHVLSEPRPSPKPDARGFWIVSCSCGYVTSPDPSPMRVREAAGDHLRAKTMTDADDQGDDDEPAPTPHERAQGFARRAQEAQDRLGWADPEDHMEVTHATVDLARVVSDVARELRSLLGVLATPTPPHSGIDTCRHQQAPRVHPRYEIQESGHAPED